MKTYLPFLITIAWFSLACSNLDAQSELGAPELTVCSQNLNNFGLQKKNKKKRGRRKNRASRDRQVQQLGHLVERFAVADCDIIAVQEVTGENKGLALGRLRMIANRLSKSESRLYSALVGDSRDSRIRNGFIYATDRVEVVDLESFKSEPIPKLNVRSPLHYYSRGPLALKIKVKAQKDKPSRKFALVNVHLKSKANSYKDPTKTKFELLRMEMAEGVRRIAQDLSEDGYPALILGDLNSDTDSATVEILSGEKRLKDFRENCRIDRELTSECKKPKSRAEEFTPLFQEALERKQKIGAGGSFRYKGQFELIDEILIDNGELALAKKSKKEINVGFEGVFRKGSDHKLLWAKLNW